MDRSRPVCTVVEQILRPLFMFVYRVKITGREPFPNPDRACWRRTTSRFWTASSSESP